MSGGLRLSVAVSGAATGELLDVASWADRDGLAALWLGDPRGRSPNSADSYVTAMAGALAAVTEDLRLGLFLTLAEGRQVVRLAEDVAVLDQASGGRVELGLIPGADRQAWLERAARFLAAWTAWPLPGHDETVAVIPGPAQPVLPRLVVQDAEAAGLLDAGRVVLADGAPAATGRTILVVEPELGAGELVDWLSEPDAHSRVTALRARAAAAGAQELLLALDRPPSEHEVRALGTVLVPALRAADRDVRAIAGDAWAWLTEKADLHEPPTPGAPA